MVKLSDREKPVIIDARVDRTMIASAIRLSLCVPQPLFAFHNPQWARQRFCGQFGHVGIKLYQATDQYNATDSQYPGDPNPQRDILDGLKVQNNTEDNRWYNALYTI